MRKTAALFFALALALAGRAAAEQAKPVLRIRPFSGEDLAASELAAIQNLVTSYIVEFNAFRVIDSNNGPASSDLGGPKPPPSAADLSVGGSILRAGGLYVATLVSTEHATGEKRSVSDAFSSINELILSSRRLALALFERREAAPQAGTAQEAAPAGPQPRAPSPEGMAAGAAAPAIEEAPSLSLLAGSWSGDKGVERVTLFADGRGMALLDSGTVMQLKVTINGSIVSIAQNQANLPAFYRRAGIDFATARAIAAKARPWIWSFTLSKDGKRLSGSKESVFITVSSSGELSVDNGYVREAVWTRR